MRYEKTREEASLLMRFKMAGARGSSRKRGPFRRYTALEVLDEIINDPDSDEEDLSALDDSEWEEEEDDFNQHHPLLSGLASDDEGSDDEGEADTNFLPSVSSTESSDDQQPSTSRRVETPRGRGIVRGGARQRGHRGSVRRGGMTTRGRGRGTRQSDLITEWQQLQENADAPNINAFTGDPGVKVDITDYKPVDFMELFFDGDLLNHLLTQTNLYEEQYLAANPNLTQHSRANFWQPVDTAEMKKFLALVLLMGIVRLPEIQLYWSTKVLYHIPVFSSVMPRNRIQVCFFIY